MSVIAVVPVKNFAAAKLRLRGVLGTTDCAALAEAMARDVLRAIGDASTVDRCVVVGGSDARRLASEYHCDYCDDSGCDTLSAAVARAAQHCVWLGAETLLVLPGDLPALRGADIDQLLHTHRGGLTLCPASSDGGTNALAVTPPDAIGFRYGRDSARRHLEAAAQTGLDSRCEESAAFGRDIDTADDLEGLRRLPVGPATRAWLACDAGSPAGAIAAGQ
jgi:2-phospho-L-lactate guanylyltransferase